MFTWLIKTVLVGKISETFDQLLLTLLKSKQTSKNGGEKIRVDPLLYKNQMNNFISILFSVHLSISVKQF